MADGPDQKYEDAYRVAEGAIMLGRVVKMIGFVFAAIGLVIALVGGIGGAAVFMVALLIAIIVGLAGYVAGVFITAQGQMIRATLDIAVNTAALRGVHQV
jgi:hypothetical protein